MKGARFLLAFLKNHREEIACAIVIFLVFQSNIFHTIPNFDVFQQDSNELVIGRVKAALNEGFFVKSCCLTCDRNPLYYSQIGLQGIVLSAIAMVLPFSFPLTMKILTGLVAGTTTIAVLFFVHAVERMMKTRGLLLFITLLFAVGLFPFLSAMARSVYWVPATFLLPTIYLFHRVFRMQDGGGDAFTPSAWGIVFVLFVVRFACGYEYITTVCLWALLPILYAWWSGLIHRRRFCQYILICLVVAVLAFLATLAIWTGQMLSYFGSMDRTIYMIQYVISHYTTLIHPWLPPDLIERLTTVSAHARPLSASARKILQMYLHYKPLHILLTGLLIAVVSCGSLVRIRQALRVVPGWKAALYSLVPPISWYVIGKAHSFAHPHINFVLWDAGTLLILAGALWCCFVHLASSEKENRGKS